LGSTTWPYKRALASPSWVMAAPLRETPANKPRDRE
jgi:hypothetical protein